jgi:hypothetical protein
VLLKTKHSRRDADLSVLIRRRFRERLFRANFRIGDNTPGGDGKHYDVREDLAIELVRSHEMHSRSLQLRVFCAGLLDDWDVRVGILPEGEEVLVGSLRLGIVAQ